MLRLTFGFFTYVIENFLLIAFMKAIEYRSDDVTKNCLHFSILDTMYRWSMIKEHPQSKFGGDRFMGARGMAA